MSEIVESEMVRDARPETAGRDKRGGYSTSPAIDADSRLTSVEP